MKTLFLSLLALSLAPSDTFAAEDTKNTHPNIIFILADDLGVGNIGCYGADNTQTPHIDSLARSGIRFTHAYTAPLCGPSRAIIMTGRYAFRTGATNQDATGLMRTSVETMIPKLLKPAGYKSAMIGKWGQLPLEPTDWGFDESLRFKGSGVYWSTKAGKDTYTLNGAQKVLQSNEYMPDLMHRQAIDFIARHREQPFFLYYSLSHVHGEIARTPDSKPESTNLFADNIVYMDKLVGQLVAELDRLKLRDNTLIIFFGDNGTAKGQATTSTIGGKRLQGEKGSMLEGGALVPMIVNWPAKTPAGKVSADLVDSSDFLPTFVELAGAKLPEKTTIDGRSLAAQLRGERGEPRDWIFIELARMWYAREPKWKLNQAGELFDMSNSPFEEKLIPTASTQPEAMAARKRLQAVLDKLNPAGGILDNGDGSGRHANKKPGSPK